MGEEVIGPGKSGGEGFARRLNRNDWIMHNEEPTTMISALNTCFASVIKVAIGSLVAAAAMESFRQGGMGLG
ncbi:hypothetical protein [Limnoglobus roseus]|uniref:hypothetical protein n=1 Tax=Limnoglobus roseus TaxID=2598579 RepID=UPI0011EAA0CB|nr:hypothetical protein [Limnoglobus roseus]